MTREDVLFDLEWAYNRLDHLFTVFQEGCMGREDFSGPNETMKALETNLPLLRAKHRFTQAWPNGRGVVEKMLRVPNSKAILMLELEANTTKSKAFLVQYDNGCTWSGSRGAGYTSGSVDENIEEHDWTPSETWAKMEILDVFDHNGNKITDRISTINESK